jgi:hypothetical protein
MKKGLAKIAADPRVKEVDDETAYGYGYWAYLKKEFYSPDMDCWTLHEDTLKELQAVLDNVRPSTEEELREHARAWGEKTA